MGWLNDAIDKGVREGFEDALEKICDGPQIRCCMDPFDGCLCNWTKWSKLPWWRRVFIKEPHRPAQKAVLASYIRQRRWLMRTP